MRHWNFVVRTLESRELIFLPWLAVEDGEEIPRGNCWARGFLSGIDLCRESWDEIFKDEDKFAHLLPVLALAYENDPAPSMRSWQTPPTRELRDRVFAGLSVTTQHFYDYFRSHRTQEAQADQAKTHQSGRKIGRNEPCYCGSGKKYKRCCGDVTIN